MKLQGWRSREIVFLAAMLLLLATLAVLQYRWIDRLSNAEKARLQGEMRTLGAAFARDYDGQLRELQLQVASRIAKLKGDGAAVVQELQAHPVDAPLRGIIESYEFEPSGGLGLAREGPHVVVPWLPASEDDGPPEARRPRGFVVIHLSEKQLTESVLKPLQERYFQSAGDSFAVRVVDPAANNRVVFESGLSGATFEPVYRAPLGSTQFNRPPWAGGGFRPNGPGERDPGFRRRRRAPEDDPGNPPSPGTGPGPGPGFGGRRTWQLLVGHRAGSLEAAVNTYRTRNLAISFAVLLVLGSSLAFLTLSARRSRELARREMEFVAGVSHELRTPLTVICASADNLAHGMISDPSKVQRYGQVIGSEGRRLGEMVERILAYAGVDSNRNRQNRAFVPAASLLDKAMDACASDVVSSRDRIHIAVADDAPGADCDAAAMAHCVGNLISNAVKYAPSGDIDVLAQRGGSESRPELRIRVSDRGPGIGAEDLPHIFEPFYRGAAARDSGTRGAGIGLSLARRIAEAHGGKLSVETSEGSGSVFNLSLPAMEKAS